MEQNIYTDARTHAMQLGLIIGGFWIVSFLGFAYTFPTLLAQLAYFLGVGSLVYAGMSLRKYRKNHPALSLFHAVWVAWLTFTCAALLTTTVQYLYFQFLDEGRFFGNIAQFMTSTEVTLAYQEANAPHLLTQMQEATSELSGLTVKEFVMSLMTYNLFIGLVFSLLSLLFLIGSKRKADENPA